MMFITKCALLSINQGRENLNPVLLGVLFLLNRANEKSFFNPRQQSSVTDLLIQLRKGYVLLLSHLLILLLLLQGS